MVEEVGERFEETFPGLSWEVMPADRGPWLFCVSEWGWDVVRERRAGGAGGAGGGGVDDPGVSAARGGGCGDHVERRDAGRGGRLVRGAEDAARVDLVLHVRGATAENVDMITQAALILLDNAIGEYDSVKRIAGLDVALLEGRPRKSELFFPLKDLAGFLDGTRGGRGGGG